MAIYVPITLASTETERNALDDIRMGPDDARTRGQLARLIVVPISVVIVLAWATFVWALVSGKSTADVKDFTVTLLGALGAPVGAIFGYYFGSRGGAAGSRDSAG